MLTDYISPGEKVEIQAIPGIWQKETEEDTKVYGSKIYDIASDERIDVMMPTEKGKLILLPVDGEYRLAFYSSKGMYQCEARVVDRYKSNNIYILSLEFAKGLQKLQRREYYRFNCAIELVTRSLTNYEEVALENNHGFTIDPGDDIKKAVIADISGGGLRFIAGFHYEEGDKIYISYKLNIVGQIKEYHIVGVVLRMEEMENRKGVFEHRIKYTNIDENDREEIIHYIFEEERKIRKKQS